MARGLDEGSIERRDSVEGANRETVGQIGPDGQIVHSWPELGLVPECHGIASDDSRTCCRSRGQHLSIYCAAEAASRGVQWPGRDAGLAWRYLQQQLSDSP